MALSFVVGYQTIPLQAGYNIFAPTFDSVSGTLNLQDVKLNGTSGDLTDFIWVLDSDGIATGETYTWANADISSSGVAGWVNDDWDPVDVKITAGQGFYLYADADDMSVQVSGQVKIGAYTYALQAGYNLTGNFSPVDQNLQNIKLVGTSGDLTEVIWVLDSDGIATGETYTWANGDISSSGNEAWVNDDWEPVDVTVKAGEGLYLYADSEGISIVLPAVIEK